MRTILPHFHLGHRPHKNKCSYFLSTNGNSMTDQERNKQRPHARGTARFLLLKNLKWNPVWSCAYTERQSRTFWQEEKWRNSVLPTAWEESCRGRTSKDRKMNAAQREGKNYTSFVFRFRFFSDSKKDDESQTNNMKAVFSVFVTS